MILKVLATGKNRKVIKDVCEHLESDRGYITVKCAPNKAALFDITLAELPKVIIICLGDETRDTIASYDVLKTAAETGGCTIIVIANQEDERMFLKYSQMEKVLLLSRPISLFVLYEKLNEIEKELEKNKGNQVAGLREVVLEHSENSGRKQILVVDDDSQQLVHIKNQLDEFYDVTLVKSADAMFKALAKRIPDLILLDYMMPEINGPDALRSMREVEDYIGIPVIFLTGVKEKKIVIETLAELMPQGYIIKPAKKSELVAKIIDVLG